MIVYEPYCRVTPIDELIEEVCEHAELSARSHAARLDGFRSLLILCGRLEQAIEDTLPERVAAALGAATRRLTDTAARVFVRAWLTPTHEGDRPAAADIVRDVAVLRAAARGVDCDVSATEPEGFAYYTLYPEQYVESALQWAAGQRDNPPVFVIGVRSIGTTLSAVVTETLKTQNLRASRITVRPTGHPFHREAAIQCGVIDPRIWALVVDEGPGASGSSMAACAEALLARGVHRERIAFLPGHAGMPGQAASESTIRWWRSTPRFVVTLPEMRWRGRTLADSLGDACHRIGIAGRTEETRDLGGGLWRDLVCCGSANVPAAAIPFERSKYLCRIVTNEGQRSILWKFAGTQAREEMQRMDKLAAKGWTNPPLGQALGFVAREWADGHPLRRSVADLELARALGRYIADASTPPVDRQRRELAARRLETMVFTNLSEAFGEGEARVGLRMLECATPEALPSIPGYGDGRLDPHEWIRSGGGRLIKTDCGGHDRDHTCVGWQLVWWDLAGAWEEWEIGDALNGMLMESFELAGGLRPSTAALRFYRLAYCAFRLGLSRFCADSLSGEERTRHERDFERYRDRIRALLSEVS